MKYVVLLRGVNVGGNHKVPKGELKAVLEGQGFQNVTTYINSGNALFESDTTPHANEIQAALESHFGFTIPTLVLSEGKLRTIAAAIPDEWTNDTPKPDKSGQKSDVLFLFDAVNTPEIIEQLGHKPEIETMLYIDGAVITNITRANQSKGSLQKIIGTKVYADVTIRNITTVKKLAELIGK
ncbi:DUF1697 domain-containing protein [Candidatus Saccharibacteria bacterium TM7i]|nr:DUF1697 domain-containing protein [Candidatus Saccharibacteria bacterium TM7i]